MISFWGCGSEAGIENSICGCKVCLSLFRHHCPEAFSEEYKRVYINKLTRVILICGYSYIFTHYFMMSPTSHNRVLSRFMSFCIWTLFFLWEAWLSLTSLDLLTVLAQPGCDQSFIMVDDFNMPSLIPM